MTKTALLSSLKQINQYPLNPILSEYIRLSKEEKGTRYVVQHINEEESSILTFVHKDWNKIIFTRKIRSSYHDEEGKIFLYEITHRENGPELRLYHLTHEMLRLLFIEQMYCNTKEHEYEQYEYFVNTRHYISLEIYHTGPHHAFVIKDSSGNLILRETTACLLKDPVDQLLSHLSSPLACDDSIKELVTAIIGSKSVRKRAITTLAQEPWLFNKLLELQHRFNQFYDYREFVQEILTTAFERTSPVKELIVQYPTTHVLNEDEAICYSYIQDGKPLYEHYPKGSNKKRPLESLHPHYYELFELERFCNFTLTHLDSPHILIKATGQNDDTRLIGCLITNKKMLQSQFEALLQEMERLSTGCYFNRILIQRVDSAMTTKELEDLVLKYRPLLRKLHIEKVIAHAIEVKEILSEQLKVSTLQMNQKPISPLSKIEQRERQIVSKGGVWAYRIPLLLTEIAKDFREKELGIYTPAQDEGFIELDLDHSQTVIHPTTGSIDYNVGELIPVHRPIGQNEAGVVIGLHSLDLGLGYPVKRILLIGDLSHSSRGAIRGQECIRINAAIRLAAEEKIPIDWYAASYGVQIHRERGVEGLDAAASTLREIVDNCHHKGLQINFILDETNIGAQSYWDSMGAIVHDTSGILIMTPNGSMALTGPKSLACALYGTVPSEEIGKYTDALYPKGLQSLSGHEFVHGPNSDSMLFAKDLHEASRYLLLHHYYGYLKPGQQLAPQRAPNRNAHFSEDEFIVYQTQMENFLKGLKPDRKKILEFLKDAASPESLEFWHDTKGIQNQVAKNGDLPQEASAIVQEMLIGGHPTLVLFTPTGPLTPADANIIARAIYKASSRMQVLIIGSLSGFSCDPLSMSNRQLLEGAFIAKAIVEHKGPILICNLGSLVGGTFAVFNKQLQKDLRIVALEGARVQVIGGKSAAKVVFHSSICKQVDSDSRVIQAIQKVSKEALEPTHEAPSSLRRRLISEIENKESILFDTFHNAERAMKVKSIDEIISFARLKESLIKHFEELRAQYNYEAA